jgi:hypothetical protein
MERFHEASEIGNSELTLEHRSDRVGTFDELLRHLVVTASGWWRSANPLGVAGVIPFDSTFDGVMRRHNDILGSKKRSTTVKQIRIGLETLFASDNYHRRSRGPSCAPTKAQSNIAALYQIVMKGIVSLSQLNA